MWTNIQIKNHQEVAKRLGKITNLAFDYIRRNKKDATEKDVQLFIYEKIKEFNLIIDRTPIIVAFGKNSSDPHYHPTEKSNRKLKSGDIIMIDIWARVNSNGAPFADITWMGFYGKNIPKKIQNFFDIVISARDEGIKFIKNKLRRYEMPLGKEVDKIVRDYIHQRGFGDKFIHGTGHSLGLRGPHGNLRKIRKNAHKPLFKNVAYTIEPGIYLEEEFGVRSEINFYITDDFKFHLTTDLQKKIISV